MSRTFPYPPRDLSRPFFSGRSLPSWFSELKTIFLRSSTAPIQKLPTFPAILYESLLSLSAQFDKCRHSPHVVRSSKCAPVQRAIRDVLGKCRWRPNIGVATAFSTRRGFASPKQKDEVGLAAGAQVRSQWARASRESPAGAANPGRPYKRRFRTWANRVARRLLLGLTACLRVAFFSLGHGRA